MNIAVFHNRYRQDGGEDGVCETERSLLRGHGHTVHYTELSNRSLNLWSVGLAGLVSGWNPLSFLKCRRQFKGQRPEVVHCHNFFPQFSPSLFHAAAACGIPCVMTIHNYRLLCAGSTLYRSGRPCTDCLGRRLAIPALRHRCYRDSLFATIGAVSAVNLPQWYGVWRKFPGFLIALTRFAKNLLAKSGVPEEKIVVKPNCIYPDPGFRGGGGDYVLFVGRLTEEKGVRTMLDAWGLLPRGPRLLIVGDGPLAPLVAEAVAVHGKISWIRKARRDEVFVLMASAMILVVPSLWYEGLPTVILEAFAVGLPVVCSGHGSMAETVDHMKTGCHFQVGMPESLVDSVNWCEVHRQALGTMGKEARGEYETKYSAETNYDSLLDIYSRAINGGGGQ